jgi:hypothetical protein
MTDHSATNNNGPAQKKISFLPTLTEIHNLTELEDIELLLKDTLNRELSLHEELEDALKSSEHVEISLDLIEALP